MISTSWCLFSLLHPLVNFFLPLKFITLILAETVTSPHFPSIRIPYFPLSYPIIITISKFFCVLNGFVVRFTTNFSLVLQFTVFRLRLPITIEQYRPTTFMLTIWNCISLEFQKFSQNKYIYFCKKKCPASHLFVIFALWESPTSKTSSWYKLVCENTCFCGTSEYLKSQSQLLIISCKLFQTNCSREW